MAVPPSPPVCSNCYASCSIDEVIQRDMNAKIELTREGARCSADKLSVLEQDSFLISE